MVKAFGSNRTLFPAALQAAVSDESATPLQRAAEKAIPSKAASLLGAESVHDLKRIYVKESEYPARKSGDEWPSRLEYRSSLSQNGFFFRRNPARKDGVLHLTSSIFLAKPLAVSKSSIKSCLCSAGGL